MGSQLGEKEGRESIKFQLKKGTTKRSMETFQIMLIKKNVSNSAKLVQLKATKK